MAQALTGLNNLALPLTHDLARSLGSGTVGRVVSPARAGALSALSMGPVNGPWVLSGQCLLHQLHVDSLHEPL